MYESDRVYIRHALKIAASGRTLVFYDTETTGLDSVDAEMPRIWQLAAIKRNGAGRLEHTKIINPGMPLPDGANLRKIDPSLPMRTGAEEKLTLAGFARFIEGSVLVGHNILGFDNRLLAHAYHRLGLPLPLQLLDQRHCIDTLELSKAMYYKGRPGSPADNKLATMARFLGLTVPEGMHDALTDIRVNEQVLDRLLERARALDLRPAQPAA